MGDHFFIDTKIYGWSRSIYKHRYFRRVHVCQSCTFIIHPLLPLFNEVVVCYFLFTYTLPNSKQFSIFTLSTTLMFKESADSCQKIYSQFLVIRQNERRFQHKPFYLFKIQNFVYTILVHLFIFSSQDTIFLT